jgi:hypothetical protein
VDVEDIPHFKIAVGGEYNIAETHFASNGKGCGYIFESFAFDTQAYHAATSCPSQK